MRRSIVIGLLTASLNGCSPIALDPGASSSAPPAGSMVPDPAYRPQVGDRSVLYGVEGGGSMEQLPLLRDITAFDVFERATKDGDSQVAPDLEAQGWLRWTPAGTRVVILGVNDRKHTGGRVAAQLRILDGPHKGQTDWTPLDYVARFIRMTDEPE